jgi:adenine deaminase
MFCSDDLHPDDLLKGHINSTVRRAIARGFDPITVIKSCTLNPVKHYNLGVGLLRQGDSADIIITDGLESFNILKTFVDGVLVAENGNSYIPEVEFQNINHFEAEKITQTDLEVHAGKGKLQVMKALDGQLITEPVLMEPLIKNSLAIADPSRDLAKIVVMNRYRPSKPSIAFVTGFGLEKGAIGSTVAHDSHNIIAVGTNDDDLVTAINLLVENKGGIVGVDKLRKMELSLPVAGLMTDESGEDVARKYESLDGMAKSMGSSLRAPFMTLSFMALLVIPYLKLSDKGLFDGKMFQFTDLYTN